MYTASTVRNGWLTSLSRTNRKARSPIIHVATANQLRLQRAVAG